MSSRYEQSKLRNNYAFTSPLVSRINEGEFNSTQAGWFYQLALIVKRNLIVYLRVPQTSYVKLFISVSIAALAALFF